MAWLDAFLLWLVPLAAINALTFIWNWRISIRGEQYLRERFCCLYLGGVVNAGLLCLVVGFATSPDHPSNSLFVPIGVFGMFLMLVAPLGVIALIDLAEDTTKRWKRENKEARLRASQEQLNFKQYADESMAIANETFEATAQTWPKE